MMKKVDTMESDERDQLRSLLRERSNKKSGVDWMYKEDKPEKEEYLLGRKIDRHIEEELAPPEPDKDAPGALFHDVMARRTDLDMQAKKREDPLYAIYEKEEEARKRLLRNPIRMKQLQKTIDEKKKQEQSESRHKAHKEKRRHHHKEKHDDLVSRYLNVIGGKEDTGDLDAVRRRLAGDDSGHQGNNHRQEGGRETTGERHRREGNRDSRSDRQHRESDRDSSSDRQHREGDRDSRSDRQHREGDRDSRGDRHEHRETSGDRHELREGDRDSRSERQQREGDRDSWGDRHEHRKTRGDRHELREGERESKGERQQRAGDRDSRGDRHEHGERRGDRHELSDGRLDTEGRGKTYGLLEPSKGWRTDQREERSKIALTKPSNSSHIAPSTSKHPPKRKLTADEMAEKRTAMMANARERDDEREDNVKRYRALDKAGTDVISSATSDADFVKPLMMQHAAQSSVSDRIKRNIYNIQRTKADMSKKFTDRH